jgi:FMN phosphatase YigB (HAD superfamily)
LSDEPLRPPGGVLFDLEGTVLLEVRHDRRAGADCLLRYCRPPVRYSPDEVHRHAEALLDDLVPRKYDSLLELSLHGFLRLLLDWLGLTLTLSMEEVEGEYWDAVEGMVPATGIHEALDDLRRRGIPAGIVSNAIYRGETIRRELDRHRLGDAFRFVMTSTDYAVRKPHPFLFEAAAAKLGVPVGAVWYAGNSLDHDVRGAAGAGMTALWYCPDGPPEQAPESAILIRDWAELPGLLDRRIAGVPGE